MRAARPNSSLPPRRGSLMGFELLLVLPLVFLILVCLVEVGSLMMARQRLQSASREGARAAAVSGDIDEVGRAVQLALGDDVPDGIEVDVANLDDPTRPPRSGDMVRVVVSSPAGSLTLFSIDLLGLSGRTVTVQTTMRRE
jgi:TadE-like protein